MNKIAILLSATMVLVLMTVIVTPTILASAKKSSEFRQGARDGAAQADSDIKTKNHIDARPNHIPCPPNSSADYCAGFKGGYSDEAELKSE
jgi:hypothetical protein